VTASNSRPTKNKVPAANCADPHHLRKKEKLIGDQHLKHEIRAGIAQAITGFFAKREFLGGNGRSYWGISSLGLD